MKKSIKVGLAGLIDEGFLFGALGLKSFLAEARVLEQADAVHFDRYKQANIDLQASSLRLSA